MALFQGHLLTLHYYVVDTVFCLVFGFLGFQIDPGPGRWPSNMPGCTGAPGPINWAKKGLRQTPQPPNPADLFTLCR